MNIKIAIFDFIEKRREKLKSILESKRVDVFAIERVYEKEEKMIMARNNLSNMEKNDFWNVDNINLIFLHKGNLAAKRFFELKCNIKYTIIFTGGDDPLDWSIDSKKHIFLRGINTWEEVNINLFIDKWREIGIENAPPFNLIDSKKIKKIAEIMHRINHIFGAVDMYIQTLQELAVNNHILDFYKVYNEMNNTYKNVNWDKVFNEIKMQINVFSNSEQLMELLNNIPDIIKKNPKELFDILKKNNPFHDWFKELCEKIEKLEIGD